MFQSSDISVFEVNIRFVGGLLACYALTGDEVLLYNKLLIPVSLIIVCFCCLFLILLVSFCCFLTRVVESNDAFWILYFKLFYLLYVVEK